MTVIWLNYLITSGLFSQRKSHKLMLVANNLVAKLAIISPVDYGRGPIYRGK